MEQLEMKWSEYEQQARPGAPVEPLAGPPRRCLRRVPAKEWTHPGWLVLARVVAVACLVLGPGCDECDAMLRAMSKRRVN